MVIIFVEIVSIKKGHNMQDTTELTELLKNASPYIEQYKGKTMVVKYGGSAMQSEELKDSVMSDIVLLNSLGIKVVLVHGGGPELSDMLNRLGKESKFINGLRYTDAETVEVALMILAGKINKGLVSHIHKLGGKGVGLCGIDGGMLQAEKRPGEDLGFVGQINAVNTELIISVLNDGFIPVISTVGIGDDGQAYNINADTAASEVAIALKAERLISLSDIRGVLRDVKDENSLISVISLSDIHDLIETGIIEGGMIPKVEGCEDAIVRGVEEVSIIDGRILHSLILELFSENGIGTLIKK